MRVIAISGFSGTGKTTVLENLIEMLRQKGYSVATVKSSAEDIQPPEGTDTWRLLNAGASPVIFLGPETTIIRYAKHMDVLDALHAQETDFLLIEGMKQSRIPKIWCMGKNRRLPEPSPFGICAVIVWDDTAIQSVDDSIPIIKSDRIDQIVEIVEKEAIDVSKIDI